MSRIDNTTTGISDPAEQMLILLGGVEQQEARGQRQLLNSDQMPTDRHPADDAQWEALGFTFGQPNEDDPLFCPATLPEGWTRKAGSDPRGSSILDHLGRERVSIFYKAALYDRCASATLISLGWYVTQHVEYDRPLGPGRDMGDPGSGS